MKVYQSTIEFIEKIIKGIKNEENSAFENEDFKNFLQEIKEVKSNENVVFNWECCGGCY